MTLDKGQSNYLLGSSDAEHERLIRQARRLAPVTERFFREAGIGPGQRVLDLGAGVGDVAMLLSRLVGPAGEVVAIERDPRSINRAQTRAAEAGLPNVKFAQTDIAHATAAAAGGSCIFEHRCTLDCAGRSLVPQARHREHESAETGTPET